ncbi:hypothetical protein KAR91_82235 [Candidatus Pacearchaeota archaeon]|nr:hypothetical protein [Candidatus Pacearchaeota archaeon]
MKEHKAIKLQDDPEKWVDEAGDELTQCQSSVPDVLTTIDNLLYQFGLELYISDTMANEGIELLNIKKEGARMTGKDLINKLQKMSDSDLERLIVMQKDPEGNGYAQLDDLSFASYSEEDCEIGLDKLTPELQKQGFSDEDILINGIPAIVLEPDR